MSIGKWGFKPMGRADMNADPVHDEFFSTEAIDSLAAALVRESSQNSLDARANGHVQMRLWQRKLGLAHRRCPTVHGEPESARSGARFRHSGG